MRWLLIETCAGSAAFSLHMCGARRNIVPYMGNKWARRRDLEEIALQLGFDGAPSGVSLSDAGPVRYLHPALFDRPFRDAVLDWLRAYDAADPREVYEILHKAKVPPPEQAARRTAEWLVLQRWSYGGKPVQVSGGRWAAQGFAESAAYGVTATEVFGEIKPLLVSTIRALDGAPALPYWEGPYDRTLVYIDPPYAGTTGYGHDFPREKVVEHAMAMAPHAAVMVSEAEPVRELVEKGWLCTRIKGRSPSFSRDTAPREEWVTYTNPTGVSS